MKKIIQNTFNKLGFQINRFPNSSLRKRAKIISNHGIDTLLDIGANTGQYATLMRKLGYNKKIISFEPLADAFKQLNSNALKDDLWIANNYAIGDEDGKTVINIAGNSASSSMLKMLPSHINAAPDSDYISNEEIEIKKLDSIFDVFCTPDSKIMMKVDTQGFERNVLDGAVESLKKISVIQLEMSLIPLYENEIIFIDMLKYINNQGFYLFSLENGFTHPTTNQLLQVDGLFVKEELINFS